MNNASKKWLDLFHKTASTVLAYKKFLKKHKINPLKIKTLKDFTKLPIINKNNYYQKYNLKDFFPKRKNPSMAYASSGSSGKPTFWFREDEQEQSGGEIHEIIFRDIFNITKKESTLVVVCFSMGIWVAGNYTLSACRYVSNLGYNLTTISPGIEKEDIFNILKELAPKYDNLILAGYPSFLMDIMNEVQKRKIFIRNKKINFIMSGDKFSESWRKDFLNLVKIKNSHSLINIYGSADAAILGHETPLSIFLRKELLINKNLRQRLSGKGEDFPSIIQYYPNRIFFEEVDGELIITSQTAIPLIRYNIHDIGRIIKYAEVKKILKICNLEKKAQKHGLFEWKLPLIILKGRTDVATTFYALNIFPEHIKAGIENKSVKKFLTGNFMIYNKVINRNKVEKLCIRIELSKGVRPTKKNFDLINKSIIGHLIKLNIEFRKLYQTINQKALPMVNFYKYGDKKFLAEKKPRIVGLVNKKPRKII